MRIEFYDRKVAAPKGKQRDAVFFRMEHGFGDPGAKPDVTDREATESDFERYPTAYAHYQNQKAAAARKAKIAAAKKARAAKAA